ncbi:hypothetical protein LEP1GSC103_1528 [Leptospira borgpetersenii serovar Javanica str. UI 09931]|uniref:Uncharacterized protein n=5 Tax=Leptospira borgpetersenii TaxID=174 RepID=M3HPB9_LEPBO|nr:hypothetical protein LBBP_04491 [Leptospira borgpetersenii serovar Ballum]EKP14668.1 hypothetical protein LEP1GSC128_1402 [Leptospira borgpetersenii str. 200801926]EKQ93501.1 hypothetical protein LEP1GSC101_0242 [Leptospira borgpetersenii str. UI 09149]EKQ99410.1 hypothetical protein LEP1GSC121_2249 [Leptospira borgpetersenii serovar Castellonis str. 200801910]EMF99910.1 hypothetical protein LEP1GSC123_2830 [Leptospira borgpetersenii str. 200701203]EMK08583.1 hypothetical protein LEP1GSC066
MFDPESIPIASKNTVYGKYFCTEYTKYLFYKVNCKKRSTKHLDRIAVLSRNMKKN